MCNLAYEKCWQPGPTEIMGLSLQLYNAIGNEITYYNVCDYNCDYPLLQFHLIQ